MNTQFPLLHDVSAVLEVIKDREEFIVAEREWYNVINYIVAMPTTFIGASPEETALLREARGLVYDPVTLKVLSRPYHKFFNLNEKPETQMGNVNWSRGFSTLDKLDGSMIRAIKIPHGKDTAFRLATKMGITGIAMDAEAFVSANKKYSDFIGFCVAFNSTPIFEWMTRKNRIVIDYGSEDLLILTAIRDNTTGLYIEDLSEAEEVWGIPVVQDVEFSNVEAVVEHCKTLQNAEGYVLRFNDGHMLKVKGDWYLQLHKSKDRIRFEKDVIDLIISEKIDDIKPFLLPADLAEVEQFEQKFLEGVVVSSNKYYNFVKDNYTASRKDFAQALMNSSRIPESSRAIVWKIYDGKDPVESVKDMIGRRISSENAVNNVRHLFGNVKFREIENE